jgi:tetraacyldisaccharide 4'-kinase
MTVREAGDEPYLLAKELEGVPVFVGRERRRSGQTAVERFQSRVVILDDGFQHLRLNRDLNFLLVDARNPFGNGRLFPRGALREPLAHIGRADAVILTKADLSDNIEKLKEKLGRLAPGRPIFATRYAPLWIREARSEKTLPVEALRGKTVSAFTGIGRPASFRRSLEDLGCQVALFESFRDHYWYSAEDFQRLSREAQEKRAEALVTTEKDAVRLAGFPGGAVPLWVLAVRHEFIGKGQAAFEEFLWSRLDLTKKG